ncbi:MAG: cell division protein ZapA [Candidatus Dadabacteria bacterium]|nr:cell division protein ZapA [Candidatus Dadabacteria bacterium]NIQ16785.1 cell division protein ZapA [Candidatus Dadabacteria bacterium]
MKKVKIDFFDNEYSILTDADESYVKQIAQFLESKVKEANKGNSKVSVSHPFLLASLKIIDDFFRLQREFEEFKDSAEQKSKYMVELLDTSNYKTFSQSNQHPSGLFSSD